MTAYTPSKKSEKKGGGLQVYRENNKGGGWETRRGLRKNNKRKRDRRLGIRYRP